MTFSLPWTRRSYANLLLTLVVLVISLLTPYQYLPHPKQNRLLPLTSPSPSSTPKMDRVWFSSASDRLITYFGPLDFLDNQRSFDSAFGPTPVMLCVSKKAGVRVPSRKLNIWRVRWQTIATYFSSIYFTTLLSCNMSAPRLTILIVCCMIYILLFLTSNLYLMLTGKLFPLHPIPYINVIEFSPFLPPNATSWSFSLVTLFYNALFG